MSKSIIATILILPILCFTSCSEDSNDVQDQETGSVTFEITDAPIDNANVQGAFVTVSEIRVDGQSWSGFSGKQTIDLLAYQNGNTEVLGSGMLDVGSYNQLELILDYDTDAAGNAPGCYVLTTDGMKRNLNATGSASNTLAINSSNFDVASNASATYVIDFDLRKAIDQGQETTEYSFKTGSSLAAALRAENKALTGSIEGSVSMTSSTAMNTVVVFAYKKGTYSASEASNDVNAQFQGAVTSALVNGNGDYRLSFLEEGEYDLIFCDYEDTDNDGKLELQGKLTTDIAGLLDIQVANVSASSTVTLNITAAAVVAF